MPPQKIAYFMPKNWPLANVKVSEALKNQFSDCQLDTFNLETIISKRFDVLVLNTFATIIYYGKDILKKKRGFKDCFWRTPFLYNFVKKWIGKNVDKNRYWFTFQIQSLFDCSIEGVPHFVYTDHTHLANLYYESFNKEKLYPEFWVDLEKRIYNHASLIFVRSTNIKRSLEDQYGQPKQKVTCVFAGSNVETKQIKASEDRFHRQNILFVGIDWERKGGPALLSAFEKIQIDFPHSTLTIVGCKPDNQIPNVNAMGRIPPDDLREYYKNASIFCLPTREEPFGIAFLEAMQAGLPIIGTNVGAIPDFVQNGWNGWLVEPDEVNELASALLKLLENPEQCKTFGARSLQSVQERYNWQAVANKFQENILNYMKSTYN